MQFERRSPTQVMVFGPLEAVREATWHALWNEGAYNSLIDVEKNVVAGTIEDNLWVGAVAAKAQLVVRHDGTLVSFEASSILSHLNWDTERAKKLATWLEHVLQDGFSDASAPASTSTSLRPPLADPFGGGRKSKNPAPTTDQPPQYGPVLAPKCGKAILYLGLSSLFCCPFVSIFALFYAGSALRRYKREGDPGDRNQVIAGIYLALASVIVACLLLIL